MGEVERYPDGSFCWIDLGTTDVEGAKAFYGGLLGWEFEDLPAFARAGVAFNFTYDEISPLLGVDPKDMFDTVRAIGPAHFTFSSDGGNPLLPNAVDALLTLVRYARAYGLSDAEIRQITVENPRRVLGLG